jgi:hypothetical protein
MRKITLANKLRLFVALLFILLISVVVVGVARNAIILRDSNKAQLQVLATTPDAGLSDAQTQIDAQRRVKVLQIQTATEERRQANALFVCFFCAGRRAAHHCGSYRMAGAQFSPTLARGHRLCPANRPGRLAC